MMIKALYHRVHNYVEGVGKSGHIYWYGFQSFGASKITLQHAGIN